ncbi:hypothetical protein VTL71DRAFT_6172 [Oculimacula yallundae]|uniref:DUF6590 domain-containing protein n=1 Tax=Oculimacula yallundae TaxID=86028 RepID=A0ABR4BZL3_9HELO
MSSAKLWSQLGMGNGDKKAPRPASAPPQPAGGTRTATQNDGDKRSTGRAPPMAFARNRNSKDPAKSPNAPDWRATGGGPLPEVTVAWHDRQTQPDGSLKVYTEYGEPINKWSSSYNLGMIFSAFHHITGRAFPSKAETLTEFISPKGQWICSKSRKFVVVENFLNHCLVLPIFTYGNQGLQGKTRVAQEYIGVFDSVSTKEYQPQTDNGYVLVERAPEYANVSITNFHYQSLSAYARLTAPVVHEYSTPVVIEGTIISEHLQKLLDAYRIANPAITQTE